MFVPRMKNQIALEWFKDYAAFLVASEFNKQTAQNYTRAVIDWLILERYIEESPLAGPFFRQVKAQALSACNEQPFAKAPLILPHTLAAMSTDERKFVLFWIFSGLRYDSITSIGHAQTGRIDGSISVIANRLKTAGAITEGGGTLGNVKKIKALCNCPHRRNGRIYDCCPAHAAGDLQFPVTPQRVQWILEKYRIYKHSARRTMAMILRLLHDARPDIFTLQVCNKVMTWAPKSKQLCEYTDSDFNDIKFGGTCVPFGGFQCSMMMLLDEHGNSGIHTNNCSQTPQFWINRELDPLRCVEVIRAAISDGMSAETMMSLVAQDPAGETSMSDEELKELGLSDGELAHLFNGGIDQDEEDAGKMSKRAATMAEKNVEIAKARNDGIRTRRRANLALPVKKIGNQGEKKKDNALVARMAKGGRKKPTTVRKC